MKLNQQWLQKIIKSGLLLMAGVSMSACAGLFDLGGESWKEEVLLHDGSTIIVERSMTRGGHGIAHQDMVTDERLIFTMPGTSQEIVWVDKFSEDLGSSEFNLMMLEIRKGSAYVLASPMGCLSYNKWGRPNPPYVIFQYQGEEWTRIPLQELPLEFKLPNLVISSPDSEVKKTGLSLVPAEIVKKMNAGFKQPEYKTIMREPVIGGLSITSCEKMVPYGKAGWLGLDWFSDQPTRAACLSFCVKKGVGQQHCPCTKLFKEE
jgi:hypothetical protein